VFCRLDELGLEVVGQRLEPARAVLSCRVVESDRWCRRCGCQGVSRDSVTRRLAHEPWGWRPTTLLVTVRRYGCTGCGHVWRQDLSRAAPPRAKLSRGGLRWALQAIVCQHLTVTRVAEGLGVAWNTANDAVLAEGRRVLITDPNRLDGVRVIGVDEHVWRHTRHGDKYVTVIIDLTGIRDGTGPARLLDMVDGRSKQAFKAWLAARPQAWRDGVEVVAMDGFTGFKTATAEELPDAVAVMDPFHVVRLAGDALDQCRRRVQQDIHGHRGRSGDPLYGARRTLHTGVDLLTDKQTARLDALFALDTRAGRGDLADLPADDRRLPPARPGPRPQHDEHPHRRARLRRPRPAHRADHARPDPQAARRRRPGLRRAARDHQQRPDRGDQRPARAPTRVRPRVSEPHELHRQIAAVVRRLQTPTPPSIVKSLITSVALTEHSPRQLHRSNCAASHSGGCDTGSTASPSAGATSSTGR
jgi:transposase